MGGTLTGWAMGVMVVAVFVPVVMVLRHQYRERQVRQFLERVNNSMLTYYDERGIAIAGRGVKDGGTGVICGAGSA